MWIDFPVGLSAWMSGNVGLGDDDACVPGSAGAAGTFVGRAVLAGGGLLPRLFGSGGGGGTDGGNGACGLRGAIPEALRPA